MNSVQLMSSCGTEFLHPDKATSAAGILAVAAAVSLAEPREKLVAFCDITSDNKSMMVMGLWCCHLFFS